MNTDLLVSVLKRPPSAAPLPPTGSSSRRATSAPPCACARSRTSTTLASSGLSLRVFAGRASAAASTSDLSRESLERVVDEATALAKITAEDSHAGLPDPATLIARVPDLDLEDAGGDLSPEEKIEIARRAEAAALESDPRVTNSEGAEYSDRRARYAYATSHGFAHGYATTGFSISGVADRVAQRRDAARLLVLDRAQARRARGSRSRRTQGGGARECGGWALAR